MQIPCMLKKLTLERKVCDAVNSTEFVCYYIMHCCLFLEGLFVKHGMSRQTCCVCLKCCMLSLSGFVPLSTCMNVLFVCLFVVFQSLGQ